MLYFVLNNKIVTVQVKAQWQLHSRVAKFISEGVYWLELAS
jgi:hypothetical protein